MFIICGITYLRNVMDSFISMFSYKTRNKIGRISFRFWKVVAPSLWERYQAFDTHMFLKNEMDPQFPWKEYANKKNEFFKKWGFNISQLDAEYYSRVSGIKADYYVTRSMAVHYIYPYLDRYDFVPSYMDKNIQKTLLGIPDKELGILAPEDVVYNSNRVYFSADGKECSLEEALDILNAYEDEMILKPSVETFGGRGVMKVGRNTSRKEFMELLKQYRYNFTFQKVVKQHNALAVYNPTSVNTIRIVTYRDFNNKRKVLYSCLRFGGKGSVMDNVCSGGGYTGIDIETGHLRDRKRYSYLVMNPPYIPDSMPDEVPCWDRLKTAALSLHGRLPQMGIVGWDFSLSPEGMPILIEFNPRPGVGLQQAVGPMFSEEELNEIMSHVSKVKVDYHPLGVMQFKDFPDRKTVHLKFGGIG